MELEFHLCTLTIPIPKLEVGFFDHWFGLKVSQFETQCPCTSRCQRWRASRSLREVWEPRCEGHCEGLLLPDLHARWSDTCFSRVWEWHCEVNCEGLPLPDLHVCWGDTHFSHGRPCYVDLWPMNTCPILQSRVGRSRVSLRGLPLCGCVEHTQSFWKANANKGRLLESWLIEHTVCLIPPK